MEITALLQKVNAGDPQALNEVIPLVYEELKRLASARLRHERHPEALETTALVHEAFVRLAGGHRPAFENRGHFYGIAARLMRQILVDSARARTALKRDAGEATPLAEIPDLGRQTGDEVLAVNEALERLEAVDPLKARLIEMRYFAGLTAEESGGVLDMSPNSVRRELRLAQAWLRREMAGASNARAAER